MKKAIVYINQFFAGIGGEDKADYKPEIRNELVGPATAFNSMLDAEVTHTIICGDNYIGSNPEEATEEILGFLEGLDFDLFVAGPAFQAGRYGVACGRICKAVKEKFGAKVITSMHPENPGVEMYRKDMVIFKGGKSAREMKVDVKAISNYANKYLNGQELGSAAEEGYFSQGIRNQYFNSEMKPAAQRGVEMLIKKLNGEEFVTELPIPVKDVIEPAEPIKDLKHAKIALMTTGGIVPVDNPDRIQSASATRWGKYDVTGMDRLKSGEFKTIHAGFDPAAANADPNVIMPIDVLRDMEGKVYGELHKYFYSTVGTGTTQAEAERMSSEILKELQEADVDGVIMTST